MYRVVAEELSHPFFSPDKEVALPRGRVRVVWLAGMIGTWGGGLTACLGLVVGHGMVLNMLCALLLTQMVALFAPLWLAGCELILQLARHLGAPLPASAQPFSHRPHWPQPERPFSFRPAVQPPQAAPAARPQTWSFLFSAH